MTATFWTSLQEKPWDEIMSHSWGHATPPITTHLPIQAAGSADFLHVGPAFQVARQRVIPGLNANDLEALRTLGSDETLLVQFAFSNPPSMPDFRRTRVSLEDNRWPLAHLSYYSYEGLLYQFEYFSHLLLEDKNQSVLWIRGVVSNQKPYPLEADIRAQISFPRENETFDYHYAPFYWDASKWQRAPEVTLQKDELLFRGQTVGKIETGDFEYVWESATQFEDQDYGEVDFRYAPPHPSLRLKNVRDALHLHTTIEAHASATFELAFLINFESATHKHRALLRQADAAISHEIAKSYFRSLTGAETAKLTCKVGDWGDLFAHWPIGIAQLLVHLEENGWMPTQGGSSERHFVWVTEATQMLTPLLQLGHFEPVRRALDFIFSLQDSGLKPKGRLTSTEGAVGTSGPKWLCSTGSALSLAADYYLYSRDKEFLSQFLPRLVRAADWIVGELRATRQLNPDGSRPIYYGLMPFGCSTDGDMGHVVAFTDAYTFEGLDKAAQLLENINHPRATEFRSEVEQYRNDIGEAVCQLARPDGYIERKIVTGDPEEEYYEPFDQIAGAFHLIAGGALDPNSEIFARYIDWKEAQLGDDLFFGRMDTDTIYIGVAEWIWQEIYLRRGEQKKAFALTQIALKYSQSLDAHQTVERFRQSDPTFCPWQPNGSCNGRLLDMMVKSLYFENDGEATLFGAIPFAWLRQNHVTELTHLHTPRGPISLRAEMQSPRRCLIRLCADEPHVLPNRVRFPADWCIEMSNADETESGLVLAPDATQFCCVARPRGDV